MCYRVQTNERRKDINFIKNAENGNDDYPFMSPNDIK